MFSGAAPIQYVSWNVECTLQNTPNFLARAAPENTPENAGVFYCLVDIGLFVDEFLLCTYRASIPTVLKHTDIQGIPPVPLF